MAEIFINYRRNQTQSDAQHLATLLTSDFGKNSVFIDVRNIDSPSDWLEQLQTKVSNCKVLISVIGPDWFEVLDKKDDSPGESTKDLVHDEIAEALRLRIPVLPIMLNGASVPESIELPLDIRDMFRRHAMNLRSEEFLTDAAAISVELKKIIRNQRGLSRSKVAMLMAASLALGLLTGPLLLSQLGSIRLSPISDPDEALRQEQIRTLKLLTENEIAKNTLAEDLKAAKADADDARAKLGIVEEKIKNKQQEIEDLKTLLLDERENSVSAARRIKILVYQIEGLKRSIAEEKISIAKLVEQLQSKNEQIKVKHQQISHLQSYIDGITIPNVEEKLSNTVITVPAPHTLKGHSGWVHAASFSPDNHYLVSGSWDNTLTVWDRAKRGALFTLEGHRDRIEDVVFSPDGQTILSASADKTLKLWSLKTRKEIGTLEGHWHSVLAAAFSPDGNFILSGGKDKRLVIWDAKSRRILWDSDIDRKSSSLEGHSEDITDVAFSPDGRLLLSASRDKTIKLWDFGAAAADEKQTFTGHSDAINTASFSPDGRYIVSGSDDKTLKIWDMKSGRITTLKGHKGPIHSAAFSPDGRYIISASEDGALILWRQKTGRPVWTLEGHSAAIHATAFSPDGRHVVSGSNDKTLKLWDVSVWTQVKSGSKTGQYRPAQ